MNELYLKALYSAAAKFRIAYPSVLEYHDPHLFCHWDSLHYEMKALYPPITRTPERVFEFHRDALTMAKKISSGDYYKEMEEISDDLSLWNPEDEEERQIWMKEIIESMATPETSPEEQYVLLTGEAAKQYLESIKINKDQKIMET